jgi:DNA-binding transcriptional ArsR family regulator
VRIVRTLTVEGALTASRIAVATHQSPSATRHHLRVLEASGAVQRVRAPGGGRGGVAYRALALEMFDSDEWAQLPLALRHEIHGEHLQHIERDIHAAFPAGGFDRTDAHVSWTLARLDEPAYAQLAALLDETLERALAIRGSAAERSERGASEGEELQTEVVILHFLRDRDREAAGELPALADARARTYELAEALADEVPGSLPDWSLIAARASELAELARRQHGRG